MTLINPTISDETRPAIEPRKKRSTVTVANARPEKIRAELNIEKWPAIWHPTHSKNHSKLRTQSRTLERESAGPDGTKTVSKVTINPIAQLGDLTTEDQRTLYALIKHWEERGKPTHETLFSIRHVAKLLHKKGWGTNVIDAVTGSLERLRGTLLVWTRSYRSKDQRVENLETVYINILSKLKIIRRKVDGHVTTEAGYFQFDDHILKNLLNNYTKPFLFDVFIDIKGEIALKLYSYLDLIMADKPRFERCTKDLFRDLGLDGQSYRNPSKRKQNLQRALDELSGILLTTGVLASATIEKTKDGRDYKAVFRKTSRADFTAPESEMTITFAKNEPVVINDYQKGKEPLMEQAEELVRYFHRSFHGVESHAPQSKETGQALSLISQHGLEAARGVIDFAREEAARSDYRVQHFGGVLSYTSRAVARALRPEPRPVAHSAPAKPEERKRYVTGEQRLTILTAEQLQLRFAKAKDELLRERPSLAQFWKLGTKAHESLIRSRVIRQLDSEPMDLMAIDPRLTATYPWLASTTQNLPPG